MFIIYYIIVNIHYTVILLDSSFVFRQYISTSTHLRRVPVNKRYLGSDLSFRDKR